VYYSLKQWEYIDIIKYYIQFSNTKMETKIDELLENVRAEIKKLKPQLTEEQSDNKQKEVKHILEQAVLFADNVLKRLVSHTVGEDIDELFDNYVKTRGAVLLKDEDNKEEYTLNLDMVDHDYMLDLKQFTGHSGVKERIVFLLNTVKVLYCTIKDHMKIWAKKNNTTFNHVLQIGLNTTLFLDKDSEKRIGIILTRL
jgi:hypothetical protein